MKFFPLLAFTGKLIDLEVEMELKDLLQALDESSARTAALDNSPERAKYRQLSSVDWRNKGFTWDGAVDFTSTPESLDWASRQLALRLTALVGPQIEGLTNEGVERAFRGWTWVHTVRVDGQCNLSEQPGKSFSIVVRPVSAYLEGRYWDCQILMISHKVRRWIFGLVDRMGSLEVPSDVYAWIIRRRDDPWGLGGKPFGLGGKEDGPGDGFPFNEGEIVEQRIEKALKENNVGKALRILHAYNKEAYDGLFK